MSSYDPSDFQFGGAGFSSRVDTDTLTFGPLGDASSGINKLTPRYIITTTTTTTTAYIAEFFEF